jgi:hypothetical protein
MRTIIETRLAAADTATVLRMDATEKALSGLREVVMSRIGFVEAVKNGTATPVTGHDGRMAVVIATAAQRSVRLARPVRTAEIV